MQVYINDLTYNKKITKLNLKSTLIGPILLLISIC